MGNMRSMGGVNTSTPFPATLMSLGSRNIPPAAGTEISSLHTTAPHLAASEFLTFDTNQ
jgi:hypothetical protein